jgi:hypothetical protein
MNRISLRCLALLAATAAIAVGPAHAQFGNILGGFGGRDESAPRPPADVPSGAPSQAPTPAPLPPPAISLPPDQRPAQRSAPPPARNQANGGGIQSQPLPPPPGGLSAPPQPSQPDSSTASQQPPSAPPVKTLPGLPDGQRQPRGTAQDSQPNSPGAGQKTEEAFVERPGPHIANPGAIFAGLDKITGRITSFTVAIGETVQFGALQVTPRACYTRKGNETGNTDGFIEVDEVTLEGEVKRIFTGWMFASSPGLHAVEHPIYDVWLTDCQKAPQSVAETKADDNADDKANDASPPPPVRRNPPRGRRSSTTR